MPHITIIGGGITGLTTAFYLQKLITTQCLPLTCTIIESAANIGGKIVTEKFDNFTIEGGPDSFITRKPYVLNLCKDLGIEDKLIPINSHNTFHIFRKNNLVPLIQGLYLGIPDSLESVYDMPMLSFASKVEMMAEIYLKPQPSNHDESLENFIKRHFGKEAFDTIYAPIMAGIYGTSPEKLSMRSLYPQLLELEHQHGSLINSISKLNGQNLSSAQTSKHPVFMSFKDGMNVLAKAILDSLKCELKVNTKIRSIAKTQSGYDLIDSNDQQYGTHTIVFATPAYITSEIVTSISNELAQLLDRIQYTSTATITLGYKLSDLPKTLDLRSSGFLIPFAENRKILGCAWASKKFKHRAPEDVLLIRVFIGGPGKSHLVKLSEYQLMKLVQDELNDILKINHEPIFHKLFRWQNGNPQYEVGHLDWLASLDKVICKLPGINLTGSSYNGIGIPDCVHNARLTAEKIANEFC